ncbi:SPRY2 [Bugula neritina]|uniref:SPRY2 n=1 Tax=Bugula neritina TaxID=10212 RepID=A0A7J7JZU1_BUGNE|nr:SPRY2 [Bugula neritina]
MENSRSHPSPPPLPSRSIPRPGRAISLQNILSARPETRQNEYVDASSIATSTPKLPPKLCTSKAKLSIPTKPIYTKDILEQHENAKNELRESLQSNYSDSRPPDIPPRKDRPPPLPPREAKAASKASLTNSLPAAQKAASHSEHHHPRKPSSTDQQLSRRSASNNKHQSLVLIITDQPKSSQFRASRLNRHHVSATDLVTSSQPVRRQPESCDITLTVDEGGGVANTIICQECGQCRCAQCSGYRKLPERWLCEGNCYCSADSVVNTLTCMCCVKSCFKTCMDNADGSRIEPCSCTETPHCVLRWSALTALSLCLPCLCCYVPMKLGVAATTACYNSSCFRKRGCNCEK